MVASGGTAPNGRFKAFPTAAFVVAREGAEKCTGFFPEQSFFANGHRARR
jgi:hypothetical protein